MTTYTVRRRWQTKETLTTVDAATPDDAYEAYAAAQEDEPLDRTDVVIEPVTAYSADVFGDQIRVIYQPHNGMWLSPAHGEQSDSPADAMRAELRAYMQSCGEDVEALADEIEGYVTDMRED